MNGSHFGILLVFLLPFTVWGQEYERLVAPLKDSNEFKIVFRTEENTGLRQVTVDNMTVKVKGDTTQLYYMRYGDGLVSRIMVPYSIMDDLISLESAIIDKACQPDECEYSVLIEHGDKRVRIPIDMLSAEMISSFMLSQEE